MQPPGDVELRASSGSKRVHGPRPLPPPPATPRCLLHQELGGAAHSQKAHCWCSFSHFRLLHQCDAYAQHGEAWPPFFLRRRSPVREVLAAQGLVLALCESGVCTAFDQGTGEPLCFLNAEADEVIRSLFLNQHTLITVSIFSGDALQGLKVRATPLTAIRAGRPHPAWRPLFTSEVLCWPGFVEFDDVNHVAITCCAETRQFKVWDLCAPHQPRFYIDSRRVRDLKIADGAILLTLEPERGGQLLLHILDLAQGECVQEVRLEQQGGEGWELVELFGSHLLTKPAGGPLRITDVVSGAFREVGAAQFPAPEAFIHLPFNRLFLAFWGAHGAQLWNFQGERLATLAGAALSTTANTVYVSNTQDLLFVYCPPASSTAPDSAPPGGLTAAGQQERGAADGRAGSAAQGSGGGRQDTTHLGCVRVFDLLTGCHVAAVQQPEQAGGAHPLGPAGSRRGGHPTASAVAAAALKHVTALLYDQASHRLYTGTADGKVQAWGL